jgi:hypothetical protein
MNKFSPPHHLDTLPYLRVGIPLDLTEEKAALLARNPTLPVLVRRAVVSSKRFKTFYVPAGGILWWPEAKDREGTPGLVRIARIEPYFNDLYYRVGLWFPDRWDSTDRLLIPAARTQLARRDGTPYNPPANIYVAPDAPQIPTYAGD